MNWEIWQWAAVLTAGLSAIASLGASLWRVARERRQAVIEAAGPPGSPAGFTPGTVVEFRVTGAGRRLTVHDAVGNTRSVSLDEERTERLADWLAGALVGQHSADPGFDDENS